MSTRAETPVPLTPTLLRGWPLPGGGSGKADRGSVLVVGGARKTPGAALLAGVAALRSGAGRLTLAVAESTAVQVAVAFPECGVVGLPETARGSVKGSAASLLADEFSAADAVLIGPGLDDKEEALGLLRGLLLGARAHPKSGPAVVLDAYALGCLPELADDVKPWAGRLILTPNTTEAAILLGREVTDLKQDVRTIAETYGAIVSCQGIIVEPGGESWEITTGHSGLGTSGSGDVMAGAIAGLRARGTTGAQATCWGTHLHAAAGDRLASRLGGLGYLARELCDELPALMVELSS
ncbi:MAG TPA: NAD(P)H-hydrate dehydratase [Arthrobacter sp.]|nr:NAD(P)H-hydrate dehydratase [Arthrobacter sp.]